MDEFEDNELEELGQEASAYDDGQDQGASSGCRKFIILGVAILLVIICAAAAYLLLQGRISDRLTVDPLPTLVPTAVPLDVAIAGTAETVVGAVVETVEAKVEEDPVWAQILAEGEMSVGTSADYPPFEYYTADLELTGLDIAIIQEIGRRLSLKVELHDMAFDGLGSALQVNQIDVAISAISVTEERRQSQDFSNVYYVGADALLAGADSSLTTISNLEQLHGLRLGVQNESVYDNWAESNLVEAGLMSSQDLQKYQHMDDALVDLAAGRIDLVAMDLGPAETAVALGGVKIVAQNLNSQHYAIAVPKGSTNLLAAINRALFEMQGDGTLTQLIIDFVQLPEEEIQPLPTPTATPATPSSAAATPTPFTGCIDSMEFVADLDSGAGAVPNLAPGQTFRKGWRLQNTGTCAWNSDYALIPVEGNVPAADMGGTPIVVTILTQPGQTFDFWADLTAPTTAGSYVEYWSMTNARTDRLFGDRVWVAVGVIAPPTATPLATATPLPPLPTQTPVASISFTANPQQIEEGGCSTLTWSTQNVQAVYLYPQGQNWQDYGVVGSGTQSVCPATTTTYELRVVLRDGSVVTQTATVTVIPTPVAAPTINKFTATPTEINLGQCVTVEWAVSGEVSSVTIVRSETIIWPNAPVSGSTTDCPPAAGDIPYRIDATGPGGSTRVQHFVRVLEP
jgi:polar amino acid transport system substrate-binding protein